MAPSIDHLNALFELVGAMLAWQNADAARTARPAGCSPALIAFSALWAVECIPYYLAHGDVDSALLASLRCLGHVIWSVHAWRWLKVPPHKTPVYTLMRSEGIVQRSKAPTP